MKLLSFITQIFTAFLFVFVSFTNIQAQGWYQAYPDLLEDPTDVNSGTDRLFDGIIETKDGGFFTWGFTYSSGAAFDGTLPSVPSITFAKTDLAGNLQWSQVFEDGLVPEISDLESFSVASDASGDAYMGFARVQNASVTTFRGIGFDNLGNILNTFELTESELVGAADVPPNSSTKIIEIIPSPDNTFIVLASNSPLVYSADANNNQSWISKMDINGNILWTSVLDNNINIPESDPVPESGPTDITLLMTSLDVSANGEIAVSGVCAPSNTRVLFKFDNNGNQIWRNDLNFYNTNTNNTVKLHPSGDVFVLGRYAGDDTDLTRLNAAGDTLWTADYPDNGSPEGIILDLCILNDGNIGLVKAEALSLLTINTPQFYFSIIDVDNNTLSTGNVFSHHQQGLTATGYGEKATTSDLIATSDNRMAFAGLYTYFTLSFGYPFIIKPDTDGTIFTVEVSGNIYIEENGNCVADLGEQGIPYQFINGGLTGTLSQEDGSFAVDVFFAGPQTISHNFNTEYPYDIWQITPGCSDSIEINVIDQDISGVDFAISPLVENCPRLEVQVLAGAMRPGFTNVGIINYGNIGTGIEDSAYVNFSIESPYTLDSASMDYTYDVNSNSYEFFIGELAPFESEAIYFTITLDPSVPLETVFCMEAFIGPFDRCNLEVPDWDGSELRVEGTCEGDSVVFTLENIGEGNMQMDRNYSVYADDLLIQIGEIQLNAGESMDVKKFADGLSYRMEANQSANLPEPSYPEATVEMCNATDDPSTMGLILGTPRNDQAYYIDIECATVTGSFDPNDKRVVPAGISDQNYVNLNDALEYTIRFQNTGTDTAFNVFILDTLSEFLDISTFNPGPATHEYELSLLPGRVLRWDFPNILLPDSTTNLIGSNGALRFTIRSVQDIPQPTEIHNTAAIFFDFNEPIITEDMFITICDDCLLQTLASDGVYFDGKVLLEGPYDAAGLMTTNLQNLIPMNQPFANAPYLYNGNEQLAEVPVNMVDWVLVEARAGAPANSGERATTTVETKAAILLNDGSIRGIDGISGVKFENLTADAPYHFCIRHRNHLDVLTATALFPTENMVYDFTTGVEQAIGNAQMKWFGADSKAVMYVGDFNSDGVIQTTDYDLWTIQPAAVEVYDFPDANLDGVIQVSDFDQWFFNKAKVGTVEIGF